MRLFYLLVLSTVSAFSYAQSTIEPPANGAFWQHVEPSTEGTSYHQYLNAIGAASVSTSRECSDCAFKVQVGQRNFTLGSNYGLVTYSRYKDITYALVYRTIKEKPTRYYLLSSTGTRKEVNVAALSCNGSLNSTIQAISIKGEILCARSEELIVDNTSYALPTKARHKVFGLSYDGYWQLTFIGADFKVYSGNEYGFQQVHTLLNDRSDFDKTLSSFPYAKDKAWVAVYEYSNKRNKTLSLYKLAPKSKTYRVTNTITNDIGINPELYLTQDNTIRVSSAPRDNTYYYEFNEDSLNNQRLQQNPYTTRDIGEISISGGVRQTFWNINQKVNEVTSDGDPFARTDYDLDDSLMYEVRATGRILSTILALSYLQNKTTEDMSSLEKAASNKLFGSIGFTKLFKGASILRLEYSHEKIAGEAVYRDINSGNAQAPHLFQTDLKNYSLIITKEQGVYWGLNYKSMQLPLTIGFYTQRKSPIALFDPEAQMENYHFVYGYNSGQYSGRYMFNDRRFYVDGRFEGGMYKINPGGLVKQQAKDQMGLDKVSSGANFSLSGVLELGYLWQKRSLKMAGVGMQAQVGVNAYLDWYLDATPESNSDLAEDKIETGLDLTNFRYGPFARLSIIF